MSPSSTWRRLLLPSCLLILWACAHGQNQQGSAALPPATAPSLAAAPVLDQDAYRRLVVALTAPELEGRGVMTEGNARAAALLEREFQAAGLKPAGPDGSWRQCFQQPVSMAAREVLIAVDQQRLSGEALSPAPFSGSGEFEGELVFAGYGIHAPELNYDDYRSLEATDKIVLLMRFEPQEADPKSAFSGDKPSRYSDLRRKVFEAKGRGAKAVLLVAPPRPGEDPDQKVPVLSGAEAQSSAGLPVVFVLPAQVEGWLRARGTSLAEQVAAIDHDFASRPITLGRLSGVVKVERQERKLCNVIGRLPGAGALAGEVLVIGAHFDHLGLGQDGSLQPGQVVLHPGADDNASGTAGLVVLARALAGARLPEPRRTLLFAAFNAEEVGMAGSSIYVGAPPVPLASTNAMINLDMIGWLRDGQLTVLGSDSGDVWTDWLGEAQADWPELKLAFVGDGYGPSDQTPFYAKGIPVLHFFTGVHEGHHSPQDTSDKLNTPGAMAVLSLVTKVALRAATRPARIAYRETSSGPSQVGDTRSFNAYLGTIPDFSSMSPGATGGVKISGVRKDSPAEKAGLKAGDRIVRMAGKTIDNLYDMSFVLRDHRPGEVIEVVVVRDGRELSCAATLGARSTAGGGMPGGARGGAPPKH